MAANSAILKIHSFVKHGRNRSGNTQDDADVTLMILSMFIVAGGTHGFARVERNTPRFVIIVLRTAAVKLAHKSEGSRHEIFQISSR